MPDFLNCNRLIKRSFISCKYKYEYYTLSKIPDNIPSPTDFLDIFVDSVIRNSFNLYELDKHENLKNIAELNTEGKEILKGLVGSFNFYFENFYNFLNSLHFSMHLFDKASIYTDKKNQLIEFILSKLKDGNIPFDVEKLTNAIGKEDLE